MSDRWLILTGCRYGRVRRALCNSKTLRYGIAAGAKELDRLTAPFGKDRVVVELIDHRNPAESTINHALADLARDPGLSNVATGNLHYAAPTASPAPLPQCSQAPRPDQPADDLVPGERPTPLQVRPFEVLRFPAVSVRRPVRRTPSTGLRGASRRVSG